MNKIIKFEGEINLIGFKLPCYILEDGTRVLSGRGIQESLKMVDISENNNQSGSRLGAYWKQTSLQPYLYKDKQLNHYDPIICFKRNYKIDGYEATGYQYAREKTALQIILKAFISDEILKWQHTFQLSFYKEIFRLWDVPFTPEKIKRKPQFIGKLTNRFIYYNMPEGVFILHSLKSKTPKTDSGCFKYRLHQSLTPEIGREELKKVIQTVETLASIASSKAQFIDLVDKKYTKQMPLFSDMLFLSELDQLAKNENAQ